MTVNGAKVMVMAGGTGGHVFPALAVADALRALGAEVVWMGSAKGLEGRVVPQAGYQAEWITVQGLRGKGVLSWLSAPFKLLRAVWQALRAMRRQKPVLVVGMGGFASGPGGLAAWLLRLPLLVHEQNAVAGLTNRWLSKLARRVLEAFPDTFPMDTHAVSVGNPVRADILALPAPAERFAGREGPVRILVIGGSLGALALNRMVPAALAQVRPEDRPQVWHQAGRTLDKAQQAYGALCDEMGENLRLVDFIEDMAQAYSWADLVVCRAGALTVAELAAAGLPALLVPFPYAVDDHQTVNGRYLVEAGAALLIQEAQLTPEVLVSTLTPLLRDRQRLLAMAEAAYARAWTHATRDIVEHCLAISSLSQVLAQGEKA